MTRWEVAIIAGISRKLLVCMKPLDLDYFDSMNGRFNENVTAFKYNYRRY